ncbi:MAG: lipoyl(octanoyl) transferase [Chloroflexi bacterium RBG_19FT_COMBO_50_10]|nr:MAG: lipoyl(octanoyl) transferase [Chloroflexi bacterium RBG_19FT_COMBO_50_10]
MQPCHIRCLGLMPYQQAWDLQAQLAGQVAAGEIPATLLLLQHPHTITFGRSGKAANLLWSEAELKQRGIEVFWVDRGGDITYHGPGQLVGYPLLPLNIDGLVPPPQPGSPHLPQADYIGYLRKLEQVLILALHQFGVQAERIKNLTGVWVNQSKIAAIGVKVDARGISRHGFALNVAPDMSFWDAIIGCGLEGYSVTSLADLIPDPPPMQQVIHAVVSAFSQVFELECLLVS